MRILVPATAYGDGRDTLLDVQRRPQVRAATGTPFAVSVAEMSQLQLAAMRQLDGMCHADDVPLRCLIVDDNASFLRAAVALFEREGVTVVGVASNGADALRQARELRPDVILVDIVLGRESGFDLARRMFEADPDGAKVILISTHAEADFADLIDKTPVAGFVAKSELSANEIRRVAGADDHAAG